MNGPDAVIEIEFRRRRQVLEEARADLPDGPLFDQMWNDAGQIVDGWLAGDDSAEAERVPTGGGQPGWCGAPGCSGNCAPPGGGQRSAAMRCTVCGGTLTVGERRRAAARGLPPLCGVCRAVAL